MTVCRSLALATLLALVAPASGQDFQLIALGNGAAPRSECVLPGLNGTIDSTPAGDDVLDVANVVTTGNNGICETALAADDVRPGNGVVLGGGLPNGPIILAHNPLAGNGVCDLQQFEFVGADCHGLVSFVRVDFAPARALGGEAMLLGVLG